MVSSAQFPLSLSFFFASLFFFMAESCPLKKRERKYKSSAVCGLTLAQKHRWHISRTGFAYSLGGDHTDLEKKKTILVVLLIFHFTCWVFNKQLKGWQVKSHASKFAASRQLFNGGLAANHQFTAESGNDISFLLFEVNATAHPLPCSCTCMSLWVSQD